LSNAFVFSPITEVTTEEVWQYLLQVPSPWGVSNRSLVTLYNNAAGGDCPLITDISTPSCGNSRLGCWVCTVVKKDKSMQALIDNGEEWMKLMVEFRNMLVDYRNHPEWPGTYKKKRIRRNRAIQAGKTCLYAGNAFKSTERSSLPRTGYVAYKLSGIGCDTGHLEP